MNFKETYHNKNVYLLLMIVLLGVITVLDSFDLSSLAIKILLITFYCFLILRYHFLNYSILFLVLISLLCLTTVFIEEFKVLLGGLSNKAIIEHYLLYRGADITMGLVLLLLIWSLLSPQKIRKG